jgi:Phage tail lysozyme
MYIDRLEQLPETSNIEISTSMRTAFDFFKNKSNGGLSDFQICGILANIWQESGFNPRANNNNISF